MNINKCGLEDGTPIDEAVKLRSENARLREALIGLLANAPPPKGIKKDFSYHLYREAARTALRRV